MNIRNEVRAVTEFLHGTDLNKSVSQLLDECEGFECYPALAPLLDEPELEAKAELVRVLTDHVKAHS